MFEQHVLPYFQDLALTAITSEIIKQWQMEIQQKRTFDHKHGEYYHFAGVIPVICLKQREK